MELQLIEGLRMRVLPRLRDGTLDIAAVVTVAGVAPPTRVVVCETLAAMSILRHSDAVSIFPEPLLGRPETRGIVAIANAPFTSDIELLLLTQPDVPLTPAAEHFAHCLATVCGAKAGPRL